jgi:hydroxymethylpyrimidine pyrophosphatase-like HAD family hydrolase
MTFPPTIEALATDYDDTLAHEGIVTLGTEDALHRWRASGRRSILVTGRPLDDLTIFPRCCFDLAVAENGGLLFDPERDEVIDLCPPPSEALIEALLARVPRDALFIRRTVVAATIDHLSAIERAIAGFDVAISKNRGSLMVLPNGVDKASGLRAACDRLGVDLGRTIGFGDAENDLPFLRAAGFAVAVANAEDPVKAVASLVTRGERGAGVREVIARILAG